LALIPLVAIATFATGCSDDSTSPPGDMSAAVPGADMATAADLATSD
jgi:hypothetical protein